MQKEEIVSGSSPGQAEGRQRKSKHVLAVVVPFRRQYRGGGDCQPPGLKEVGKCWLSKKEQDLASPAWGQFGVLLGQGDIWRVMRLDPAILLTPTVPALAI